MSRPGFPVKFYDTVQEFYLAEAREYVAAWRQAQEYLEKLKEADFYAADLNAVRTELIHWILQLQP